MSILQQPLMSVAPKSFLSELSDLIPKICSEDSEM